MNIDPPQHKWRDQNPPTFQYLLQGPLFNNDPTSRHVGWSLRSNNSDEAPHGTHRSEFKKDPFCPILQDKNTSRQKAEINEMLKLDVIDPA